MTEETVNLGDYIDFTKHFVRFRQVNPREFKETYEILEMRRQKYNKRLKQKNVNPSIRSLPSPRQRKAKFYNLPWGRIKDRVKSGDIETTPNIKKLLNNSNYGKHEFIIGMPVGKEKDTIQSVLEERKEFERMEKFRPELNDLYRLYHFWNALYTGDFSYFDGEMENIENNWETEYKIKISELLKKGVNRSDLSKNDIILLYKSDLIEKLKREEEENLKVILSPEAWSVYDTLREKALKNVLNFYSVKNIYALSESSGKFQLPKAKALSNEEEEDNTFLKAVFGIYDRFDLNKPVQTTAKDD